MKGRPNKAGPAGRRPSSAGSPCPSRRRALQERLLEDAAGKRAVAVFFSGHEPLLGAYDVNPTFHYLTGLDTPGSALVFLLAASALSSSRAEEVLLLPASDPARERWTGKVLAAGGLTAAGEPDGARLRAMRTTGFGAVAAAHQLEAILERPLREATLLYLDLPTEGFGSAWTLANEFAARVRTLRPDIEIRNAGPVSGDLRRVKDGRELALMAEAVAITDEAQAAVLRHLKPGLYEYELQAIIECVFRLKGAQAPAFPSIVGSGPNGCILHYGANSRRMEAGDLVICDVGCRKDHYCADITRTYPVSGSFTRRQAEVYDLVLDAQAAAFEAARPGVLVRDVHEAAVGVFRKARMDRYYIHGTGHYLGLEAHDAGPYDRPLEPGVVLTIEPGLYIPRESLGVRIEDDAVITPDGARWLGSASKARKDIERSLARKRATLVL